MTRTERLLRLARLRGDRLAIAVLETEQKSRREQALKIADLFNVPLTMVPWSESEMRAAWGDR